MGQKPLSAELGCKCAHLAVHLGDEEICDLLLRAQVDHVAELRVEQPC